MVSISHLMKETIVVEPYSSKDAYGKITYGSEVSYKARVEDKETIIRDTKNNEVVSTGRIFIAGEKTLTTEDRITLPNGEYVFMLNFAYRKDGQCNKTFTVVYI